MKLQEVDKKIVIQKAMELVALAQKSLKMTMNLAEELASPLPAVYFSLLKLKLDEGIEIKRVGFGLKEDFETIKKHQALTHPNYSFKHAKSFNYKRMLLIDNTKLLFADDTSGRTFFYTENSTEVAKFFRYFDEEFGTHYA